jgi:hypothetical protein
MKKSSPKRRLSALAPRKRPRRLAARRASETVEEKIVRKYHELVDKKLQGTATTEDLAELEQTKSKMLAIQDERMAPFERVLEQRHDAMMEKLTCLTEELRRFSAAVQR